MPSNNSLRQISLKNFKRFDRFALACGPANILVGPNNAGKSTLLDSLRILHGAKRYAIRFKPRIVQTSHGEAWGYEIPAASIPVNLAHVTCNDSEADAEIVFTHENGAQLTILLHPEHLTQLYIRDISHVVSTGRTYFSRFPVDVVVVPTLSPLEQFEGWVQDETVEQNRSTRLSSRHFRNLWYRSTHADFNHFKSLVELTWPGLTVHHPLRPHRMMSSLEMYYEEKGFPREVSWAGFGFQIWLQIISHVLRGNEESIFVLDEADIYLHPDLQRSLLQLVSNNRFLQYFLATHSTEIINEANGGDIVSINANHRRGMRVKTDDEYNSLFSYIGSIENVEISKLSRVRKIIFFEGKDKRLLSRFMRRAGIEDPLIDSDVLVIGVGGFGQWKRVTEAAWTFRNILKINVDILSVFDRDYRDERELNQIRTDIHSHDVQCVIWDRKEIENYALVIPAMARVIAKRTKDRGFLLAEAECVDIIIELTDIYKHDVHGNILSQRVICDRRINPSIDPATIIRQWNIEFEKKWSAIDTRLSLLPGKQFIGDLSSYLQKKYGTSITDTMLIEEIHKSELDVHLLNTLGLVADFARAKIDPEFVVDEFESGPS